MELNIKTFAYLFLRLAPFIIVCFFSLSSILNQDYKGLIYLVGLLFTCFVTMMVGNAFFDKDIPIDSNESCNIITLGLNETASNLPLGQCVLSYTFWYLFYVINKYNYYYQNIPSLIFFPVLILTDSIWNVMNNCSSPKYMFWSFLFGLVGGVSWAMIIDSTKNSQLQLFPGTPSTSVCDRPSKSTFRCNVFKNGVGLVQSIEVDK